MQIAKDTVVTLNYRVTDPDGNRIELHCYTKDSLQGPWLG